MHPPDTPCLTETLPGIGGMLKSLPEDFVVEEIPAYEPCGEGEHLFLWVEKRDVAAEQLMHHLSQSLGVRHGDIGVAGLKDRHAVTRQYVSVPATAEANLSKVDSERIQVLRASRHRNKLRTGHLKGNRFEVLVRDVCLEAMTRASAICDVVRRQGFPNYYGSQRFGRDGETLSLGHDLLAGRRRPGDIPPSRRRFLLRLALSAVQSALFNDVVAQRVGKGRLQDVLSGDVMQVVASGGCFVVEKVDREQQRYDARETVLTGPLFGPKMMVPGGDAAVCEEQTLLRHSLSRESFSNYRKLLPGARRAAVVWLGDLSVMEESEGLRFRFTLPAGAYATVLLQEFRKVEPPAAETTSESD
jgi:tRNA pseudouridine13 synthase